MFNPAPLVWIAIWLYRRQQGGGNEAAASVTLDGASVFLLIAGFFAALVASAIVGPVALLLWLASLAVFRWAPWRLCRHPRTERLGSLLLAFAPHAYDGQRDRRRALYAAQFGHAPKRHMFAESWNAATLALQAEADGRAEDADRHVRALAGARLAGTVARAGMEALAVAALRRGSWDSVFQRASIGRGRGCRHLRLLARAKVRGDVPRWMLWASWALAPWRRLTCPHVRALTSGLVVGQAAPAVLEAPPTASRLHAGLLARAADGGSVDRATLGRLAQLWDAVLDRRAESALRDRALELGARNPADAVATLRTSIEGDLAALAGVAVGSWPAGAPRGPLESALRSRARDDLHARIQSHARDFEGQPVLGFPEEEWERWTSLRDAVEAVAEAQGEGALSAAWYGGARTPAWNRPCRILGEHGAEGAWACAVMFEWAARMGDRVGDEEAARVNRENVKVARSRTPHTA